MFDELRSRYMHPGSHVPEKICKAGGHVVISSLEHGLEDLPFGDDLWLAKIGGIICVSL